jgi:hypothetical protein
MRLSKEVWIKEFYPSETAFRASDGSVAAHPNSRQELEAGIARFSSEAKACQTLAKIGRFPKVIGTCKENGTVYLIYERVAGEALDARLARIGQMGAKEAVEVAEGVIDALSELHRAGMIHRGIAPECVEIASDGRLFLHGIESVKLSGNDGSICPARDGYSAPELYSPMGKQGPWTDVYGVGALMYRMLSGAKPQNAVGRLCLDRVENVSKLAADAPSHVSKAVMKAMAPRIEMRFRSAADFLEALRKPKTPLYPSTKAMLLRMAKFAAIAACILAVAGLAAIDIIMGKKVVAASSLASSVEMIEVWLPKDPIREKAFEDALAAFNEKHAKLEAIVVPMDESSYQPELDLAVSSGNAPELFVQGSLPTACAISLKPIMDNIGLDDYWFLKELVPETKGIPLGFSAVVAYSRQEVDERFSLEGISSIAGIAVDKKCFDGFLEFQSANGMLAMDEPLKSPAWSALISTTAIYRDVQDTLSGEYFIYPFSISGGAEVALGGFEDFVSIGEGLSQERQDAAFQLAVHLLGDNAQSILHLRYGGRIPISKNISSVYFALNPELAFLEGQLAGMAIGDSSFQREGGLS